jgi:thiamine-phosphate pyrophosphorylase
MNWRGGNRAAGDRQNDMMLFDPMMLRLMAVTDGLQGGMDDLASRVAAAVCGGATCVQVRLKDVSPREIAEVTRTILARVDVPVFVNDRFDVALAAGAAGVHLGTEDLPVADVRRVTPPEFVIGASVGSEIDIANATLADYIGIGPIYGSDSKVDAGEAIGIGEFARLATVAGKPAIGIGGITSTTALQVIQAGAVGIAVISAVFGRPDPGLAAQTLRLAMQV